MYLEEPRDEPPKEETLPQLEYEDFLFHANLADPKTFDQSQSVHIFGVQYCTVRDSLFMNFVLSNGVTAEDLTCPYPTNEKLFRGKIHTACSYSCYAMVGQIEIFGSKVDPPGQGVHHLVQGIRFTDRQGRELCEVGTCQVAKSGINVDTEGNLIIEREMDK